jgi:hypothetical protein
MRPNPWLALGFLVITLTIFSLIGYAIHEKDLRQEAEASVVARDLELAGAKAAIVASPREVVKFVTVPAAVTAAVKHGTLVPVASGKIEAKSDVFLVPCPLPEYRPGAQPSAKEPHTNGVALTFGLTGEVFLGKIKYGKVETTATFKGTAWSDTWQSDVVFAPENTHFDVKFSDEVAKAIEQYSRPWLKKHMALACPAIGVTYNPLDTTRPVNAGITCGYGFVWF